MGITKEIKYELNINKIYGEKGLKLGDPKC